MTSQQDVRLTPVGRTLMEAICRGRVSYLTGPQIVIQRTGPGQALDVSVPFLDLTRAEAKFAYIQPYDMDRPPIPLEVPCLPTRAGEDALMEAVQAAKKRKARQ